jgi:hypothetical protein
LSFFNCAADVKSKDAIHLKIWIAEKIGQNLIVLVYGLQKSIRHEALNQKIGFSIFIVFFFEIQVFRIFQNHHRPLVHSLFNI